MLDNINDGNTEFKIYLTSDYSDDEWEALFYEKNSFWGLASDKWRTLYNQGTLHDWSLYSDDMDSQILEIIGD